MKRHPRGLLRVMSPGMLLPRRSFSSGPMHLSPDAGTLAAKGADAVTETCLPRERPKVMPSPGRHIRTGQCRDWEPGLFASVCDNS